jgi:diguanylate cyclase (GGDEF)-like protein
MALLMMDLDNFKQVNDHLGHPFGDQVLRRVAQTLERNARLTDVVCRYGGEEWALILPETTQEEALQVAERLRQQIEQLQIRPDLLLTLSAGVAIFPNHARLADDLLHAADAAMFQAKRQGKNRVVLAEPRTDLGLRTETKRQKEQQDV